VRLIGRQRRTAEHLAENAWRRLRGSDDTL
jgi:hypothetical protein